MQRRGTSCKKWDNQTVMFGEDGLVGLWVADMDFKAPDCVARALHKCVDFGVFGYTYPWNGYFKALIDWEKMYHGYTVQKEWIRFSPGVVPAFNWLIQMLSEPGEAVITLTPVYYPILEAAVNNRRELVKSRLKCISSRYVIDYDDFEEKIVGRRVKVFILSSPHNPVDRVWEPGELRRLLDICKAHGVYVVSDEIHEDLVFAGHKHTHSALVGNYDDLMVTLVSPSKTFNLAGLQNAAVIIPNERIRGLYDQFAKQVRIFSGNLMGYVAAEAAYRDGRPWLESVKKIIYGNYKYVASTLKAAMPEVMIPDLEGTYLLWLDFSAYLKPEEMAYFFEKKCRLAMDYGNWFGTDDYCCVRMNLATSRDIIRQAVESIIENYRKGYNNRIYKR